MGKQKIQVLSNISLLLVAIIWGRFVASQMALDANLSSAFIMFVRFAIATIIIGVVFYKDLKANMKKEHLKGGIVIGLFLFWRFMFRPSDCSIRLRPITHSLPHPML